MSYIDVTGKTEEEAISRALEQLKLDRDDVSVQILERAKSGFLGIGSTPAKVRVTYGAEEEEPAAPVRPAVVEKPVEKTEKETRPAAKPAPGPRKSPRPSRRSPLPPSRSAARTRRRRPPPRRRSATRSRRLSVPSFPV